MPLSLQGHLKHFVNKGISISQRKQSQMFKKKKRRRTRKKKREGEEKIFSLLRKTITVSIIIWEKRLY